MKKTQDCCSNHKLGLSNKFSVRIAQDYLCILIIEKVAACLLPHKLLNCVKTQPKAPTIRCNFVSETKCLTNFTRLYNIWTLLHKLNSVSMIETVLCFHEYSFKFLKLGQQLHWTIWRSLHALIQYFLNSIS